MANKLRLSPEFHQDLADILATTEELFGDSQLQKYRRQILDTLDRISTDPSQGRHRDELAEDVRVLRIAHKGQHATHLIVYRLAEDGLIDISRILHESQDLPRHLSDDFKADDDQ